jgi:hypothetical protein
MNRIVELLLVTVVLSCTNPGDNPKELEWQIEFTGSHQGIQEFDFDHNGNVSFKIILKSDSDSVSATIFASIHDSTAQRRPIMQGNDTIGIFGGGIAKQSGIYEIYPDGSGYWFTRKIR